MSLATVAYQIGTYSGRVEVSCAPDDETHDVIASAKAALRRKCGAASIYPGGACYESWEVVEAADDEAEAVLAEYDAADGRRCGS